MNSIVSSHDYIKLDKGYSYAELCIGVILICALLTGFVPQIILSVVVLVACAFLATTKELYLVFPIMLFYYAKFGQFAGMSVYRYYSLLFILVTLLTIKTIKFKKFQVAPVILYVLLFPRGFKERYSWL